MVGVVQVRQLPIQETTCNQIVTICGTSGWYVDSIHIAYAGGTNKTFGEDGYQWDETDLSQVRGCSC
jgi:hypothetical protein